MTKCDGCGEEVGKLFCGNCREKIEKESKQKLKDIKLIPLLYWDIEKKCYRFGCKCFKCPWNVNGVCSVESYDSLNLLFQCNRIHKFDGDNIIKQACG